MMKILIDPRFMERLVFERSRQEPNLEAHYGREFAGCFEQRDLVRREQAFSELHHKWFECFGFRAMLLAALAEFPRISDEVDRCIVDGALKSNLQGADLRGAPGRYTLHLRVQVGVMLCTAEFQQWARHELMHVEDMLDPKFGFDPSVGPSGTSPASQNLHRERYAVLWALSIDMRLHALHGPRHPLAPQRTAEIMRAFKLPNLDTAQQLIEKLNASGLLTEPTHRTLLERADCSHERRMESGGQSGNTEAMETPPPGNPCPLCRFPTFDWQPCDPDTPIALIQLDFPDWNPSHGICGRCNELYRSRRMQTLPPGTHALASTWIRSRPNSDAGMGRREDVVPGAPEHRRHAEPLL